MLNKSFNLSDLSRPAMAGVVESLERLRQEFILRRIPYHVDGELEFQYGCLPRFWEYASAVCYGDIRKGMRVLDAGCGYSLLAPWLAKNGFQVWANDRTPYWKQREAQMKHIGKRFHLDLYDLAHTGYPDEYFDRVLCVSVIEHIPEGRIRDVVLELNRIMKDDAILVVTFDLFREHIPYGKGSFYGAQYCQYFSADSIQQALLNDTCFDLLEPGFLDDTDWLAPPLFGQYNFGRIFLKKNRKFWKGEVGTRNVEKPLRVAHVSFDFYYGGIQEQVQILVEHSTNPAIEHFIVACGDGPLREWTAAKGIPHAVISESDVASFCSSYEVDVVVTHIVNGTERHEHLYAYDLFVLGIPTINQHYCSYQAHYPAWLFDHVITNAQSTAEYLPPGSRYSIVPLAINDTRLQVDLDKNEIGQQWGIPHDCVVLGRLSRLEPTKLADHTIRAMARIKKVSKKPVYLIIAGAEALFEDKGWYVAELKRLAEEEGAPEILFTGPIYGRRKAELLHLLDINLAPTSFEGYGLIFTEPAYCGVPTVTYDHSANNEVVADGGIVVPFGDLDALVAATVRLIDDEVLRVEIGKRAKQLVEKRNLPSCWCSAIEGIILQVMEQIGVPKEHRPIRVKRPFSLKLRAQLIRYYPRMELRFARFWGWLRHPRGTARKLVARLWKSSSVKLPKPS